MLDSHKNMKSKHLREQAQSLMIWDKGGKTTFKILNVLITINNNVVLSYYPII